MILRIGTLGIAAVLCAGALALTGAARAQTPSPLAEWQYSAGDLMQSMFQTDRPVWQAELGPAIVVGPIYDGSGRTRLTPGLTAELRYRDIAFASLGEGVGVNLLRGNNYRAGLALTYDLGRREGDDRTRLRGLGTIGPALELKGFAEYIISRDFPLALRINLRRTLGGANGLVGDVGVYMPLPGSSEKLIMFAGPSVSFADITYMQNYFGVSAAQAARSGYRPYNPAAGVKSVGFGASLTWFFADHWLFNTDIAVTRLLGSAAASPIVRTPNGGVAIATVAYQF